MTNIIANFSGQYSFLSNFDMHPIKVRGKVFQGNEVWFQFAKKLKPDQVEITTEDLIAVVRKNPDNPDNPIIIYWTEIGPRDAKRLGRKATLRADWEQVKEEIMLEGLEAKFTQIPDYAAALLASYPSELVEGNNWHDNYWGVCWCASCKIRGQNRLGHLLERIREKLLEGTLEWPGTLPDKVAQAVKDALTRKT